MAIVHRNFDRLSLPVRAAIDPVLSELVDALDDAYYGTPVGAARMADGWRHGVSHPWLVWDKQATPEQSKLAFELLSGALHHIVFLAQHAANLAQPNPVPEAKYNVTLDGKLDARSRAWLSGLPVLWNGAGLQPAMTRASLAPVLGWIKGRINVVVDLQEGL